MNKKNDSIHELPYAYNVDGFPKKEKKKLYIKQ